MLNYQQCYILRAKIKLLVVDFLEYHLNCSKLLNCNNPLLPVASEPLLAHLQKFKLRFALVVGSKFLLPGE